MKLDRHMRHVASTKKKKYEFIKFHSVQNNKKVFIVYSVKMHEGSDTFKQLTLKHPDLIFDLCFITIDTA